MNAYVKAALTMIALFIAVAGGGYAAVKYFRGRILEYNDSTKEAMIEGRALGQGRNQTQCLEDLANKSRECNELGCGVRLAGLLTGCFDVATPVDTICDGVPAEDNKNGYSWASATCKEKHQLGNVGCAILYRTLQEYCKNRVPRKTETA